MTEIYKEEITEEFLSANRSFSYLPIIWERRIVLIADAETFDELNK